MQPLSSILKHPLVEPQVAMLLRSRLVERPWLFAAREWRGSNPAVYRVRENGMRVLIAHRTPDVHALDQAFYRHAHDPPPAALAALEGLRHPIRALDVGANVGMWGLWLHGRFAVAHITGLEPDPENAARHRRQIQLNCLEHSWEVVEKAATVSDGPVTFAIGAGANGHIVSAAGEDTADVDGIDLFSMLDDVDLLKLDIEGGEWPILADRRFTGIDVPVVMIEFHPNDAPSVPRLDAQGALERAGYETALAAEGPPGFGVLWGYRT
jgi:FkbM family methyltransferase